MNRVLRHGRPTVPRCKSSVSPLGFVEGLAFSLYRFEELTGRFLKFAAFADSE